MSKFTKKAIVDTFFSILNEKPLSKITVTEIIEKCEINRNTFYYYFEDIYALVDYMLRTDIQKFLERIDLSNTLSDECEIALNFFKKNKTALKHLCNSLNRYQVELYFFKALEKTLLDFIEKYFKDYEIPEEDILFTARYHAYAQVGFIIDWLVNENDDNLESLFGRISRLSEDNIKDHLKKLIEIYP